MEEGGEAGSGVFEHHNEDEGGVLRDPDYAGSVATGGSGCIRSAVLSMTAGPRLELFAETNADVKRANNNE